ncbi:MAG: hypothetical protein IJ894_14075 [Bacteroidales bacterium]|nr:hypothetical protein [Bacteroidales bacterium]MBR3712268.1 hypothetical protein [Bacteroidales bacterium]
MSAIELRGEFLQDEKETELEPDSDECIRAGLREAFKEYQEGKRQFKSLDQYLKELEEL